MTHHRTWRTFAILLTLVSMVGAGTGVASAAADLPLTAPANDNFANALVVPAGGGTVTGSNVEATNEAGEPDLRDSVNTLNQGGKSVWWSWTPTVSGTTTITTLGSSFDTMLGVFLGSSVSTLEKLAENDEGGASSTSAVSVNVNAGLTYRIQVEGWASGSGTTQGNVTLNVAAPTPDSNGSVTVVAPNGGETLKRGKATTISWNFGSYPAVVQGATGAEVPDGPREFDDAAAQAATAPVRVIVGVDAPVRPEGQLSAAEVANQRAQIAQKQRQVADRLAGLNARKLRAFQTVPYVSYELSAAAVEKLRKVPEVASLQIDVPAPADLVESGNLIGAGSSHGLGFTGTGETVAILDTGVRTTHQAFVGRIVAEDCYSSGGIGNGCPGGTAEAHGAGSAAPCSFSSACFHGTHVAGIAAGATTPGLGDGVAPTAGIHAFQVFSRYEGTSCTDFGAASPCALTSGADQLAALEKVYGDRAVRNYASINMSLGAGKTTTTCDGDFRKAIIDNLRSVGIATVIASGNEGYRDSTGAPGCISSGVTVGSTTKTDGISSFSNAASFVDVLAPGSSIRSAYYDSDSNTATTSGTSMATPQVAGAWAVLKQKFPTASVDQIQAALVNTGKPIPDNRTAIADDPGTPDLDESRPAGTITTNRIALRKALEALAPKVKIEAVGPANQIALVAASVSLNAVAPPLGDAAAPAVAAGGGSFNWTVPANLTPGQWRIKVTSTVDPSIADLSNAVFNVVQQAAPPGDFTGDGSSDVAVYRPAANGSPGTWYIRNLPEVAWGSAGDLPVSGDYNGDGVTDVAVFRPAANGNPGTWYIRNQSAVAWGSAGDIPIPADYNGDGTTDIAVFRPAANGNPGTWYIRNQPSVAWGSAGDTPVRGDFNGDGSTDIAVFRPGASTSTWYIRNQSAISWGRGADVPIPADYNGDGTTDIAVFRPAANGNPGTWYIRNQSAVAWGSAGDTPVRGDFNGDGSTDIAVFRPGASTSTWYIRNQSAISWGRGADVPAL